MDQPQPLRRAETVPIKVRAMVLAIVLALASLLYFHLLDNVRAPVWDESYHLTTTARYHQGRTQLAAHPPLGMMLIASGDMASGLNRDADWKRIGAKRQITAEEMPSGFDYRGPRLAPALFGVIAAGLFCLVILELTGSAVAAMAMSILFLSDTALMVQFRSAQLDPFQIAFSMGAVLSALWALKRCSIVAVLLYAACVTAAALVRINGLMLGVMVPFLLASAFRDRGWRGVIRYSAAGMAGGTSVFILTLASYISLSPLPPDPATAQGATDAAYISAPHAQALATGHWTIDAAIAITADIQHHMADRLDHIVASDSNGSHPYQWLTGKGSILYRVAPSPDGNVVIGFFPNRIAWIISLLGVLSSLLPSRLKGSPVRAMLLVAWMANMAILQYLDGIRVVYLYHYLLPLLLGHAMAAMEWKRHSLPRNPALVVVLLALVSSALFYPLAIGDPVPEWTCRIVAASCGS